MGRFAALTTMWDGCEVGRIGLYHEPADGSLAGGIENLGGVLEGGDAGEGDQTPQFQDAVGLGEGTGEAVKDGL